MAYSYAERYNIRNLVTPISTYVPFYNKCREAIRKVAADIFNRDIDVSDNFIVTWNTNNPTLSVTQQYLIEMANRMARGIMDDYIIPNMIDNNSFPANPDDITDIQITQSVRRSVPPFACRMGSGIF